MTSNEITSIQAGNLFAVNGLNVVITGGGSGLGAMMARTLAANGANKVFIIGRREESLNNTVSSLPNGKDIIIPIVGDVISKSSLEAAVSTVKSHVSHIDVLVANSGVGAPVVNLQDENKKPLPIEQIAADILDSDLEKHTNCFRINVLGIQLTVGAFLPLLDAANKLRPEPTKDNFRPRPQIITTGSIGGFNRQMFAGLSYGPSKAAVMHFTKMLATALVPYDIRVNCLAPGLYFSEMTQGMYKSQGKEEIHNVEGTFARDVVPATRTGDEEDMAGCILYLCSRAGAYSNGNILVTDGGRLSVLPASY